MKVPLFEAQRGMGRTRRISRSTILWWDCSRLQKQDPDLKKKGSGSVIGNGEVIGIAVAVPGRSFYFPIAHGSGPNMDKKESFRMV
jgi:hypothetical protein